MADKITRPAIGRVNGVNRRFKTPYTFRPGTAHPLLNGLWYKVGCWTERSSLEIELDIAPKIGDEVSIEFVPIL